MSKNKILAQVQSPGAWRGAPRNKPVVNKLGNRNIPKPKGSHGGKLSKRVENSLKK